MPLQATSGAASYDAFGGGVAAVPQYIEDVFSTYLYTGNGSTQTITNGIDLSTKGGLTWIKSRSTIGQNSLYDTVRGATQELSSNSTNPQTTATTGLTAFNSSGFSLGSGTYVNTNTTTYSSWTFRKQPKFFDIVTFTSDGTLSQTISHSLASAPGCILLKRTDSGGTQSWMVWHRGNGTTSYFSWSLNNTTAATTSSTLGAYMTSTSFQPNRLRDYLGNSPVNGGTYIAYLYAHNAGGFGLTGTDNVISCGSFTTDASANASVTLGYEPQFVLYKRSSGASNWFMLDNMRGWNQTGFNDLKANLTDAENVTSGNFAFPTATGFDFTNSGSLSASSTYIYIAIRRGPMKVPTSGTSVFSPNFYSSTTPDPTTITTNFPVDLTINTVTSGALKSVMDRLRGGTSSSINYLRTNATDAETTGSGFGISFASNTSIVDSGWWAGIAGVIYWNFKRAPSFMDVVCYTGTGSATTVTHNLAAVPELMIVKNRSSAVAWPVYSITLGGTDYLRLNLSNGTTANSTIWNDTNPTSSVFTVGTSSLSNGSGDKYVAYLFATASGVSKVGSYVGAGLGTPKQINCGFTSGARFVLIKDTTGNDWYVWDSARGIVAGNDPYLFLNSTAAEVTSTDYVDTYSAGFELSATAPNSLNDSARTYIFLAIA